MRAGRHASRGRPGPWGAMGCPSSFTPSFQSHHGHPQGPEGARQARCVGHKETAQDRLSSGDMLCKSFYKGMGGGAL